MDCYSSGERNLKNISFLSSVLVKTMVILLFLICVISDSHARDDVERYSGKVLLEDFQVCDESPQAYRCGRAANYVKGFAKRILQGMAGNPSNSKICMEVHVGHMQQCLSNHKKIN